MTTAERLAEEQAKLGILEARARASAIRDGERARKAMLATYAAADRGRRNKDWRAPMGSADLAIIPDGPVLNARTRQMVRDNAHARSAVRAFVRNVVGCGIIPIPQARDASGKLLEDLNRQLMVDFWAWAGDKNFCDLEKRQTFWQKQRLGESERATVGEMLVAWSYTPNLDARGRIDKSRPPGLKLQSLEAEQLNDRIISYQGNRVKGGVEIDCNNAPVAYHVFKGNPNDYLNHNSLESVRIPAERLHHCFEQERVGQTRGVAPITSILQDLRDLARGKDAYLWRMIMEACVGMVIKREGASAGSPLLGVQPRMSGDTGTTPSGVTTIDYIPGMVANLGPGETMEPFIPQAPGNQYEGFTRQTLRGAGAGAGISYGQISRDFTQGTYSGQRQEMLEDRKEFEPLQELHAHNWILPIYRLYVAIYIAEGRADGLADDFAASPSRYLAADYVAPPPTWIDPKAEAEALEKLLEMRVITREEIAHMRGARLTDVLNKLAGERKEAMAQGITFAEDKDDPMLVFKRDVVKEFIADGTVADVIGNQTDLKQLVGDTGLPVNKEYTDPYLPVQDALGNPVTGEVVKDADGDVIGAEVDKPGPPAPAGGGNFGKEPSDSAVAEQAKSVGKMADSLSAVVAQLEADSAPNYRAGAPDTPPNCAACRFYLAGKCTAYDFLAAPDHVCDAFEALPITQEMPTNAKIQPPSVPNPDAWNMDTPADRGLI